MGDLNKNFKMLQFFKIVACYTNIEKSSNTEELIPGGVSANKTNKDLADKYKVDVESINRKLEEGCKVEMEHTNSEQIAKEIAMDHLYEDIDYYEKLATIEKCK